MKNVTVHDEQLVLLKRIEGQIRGIQKMIDEKRYCVDIVTQIQSAMGALNKVENSIFAKHLNSCVVGALAGKSESEKQKKINEVIELISRCKKIA